MRRASGNTAPECPWRQLAKTQYRLLYIMQSTQACSVLSARQWRIVAPRIRHGVQAGLSRRFCCRAVPAISPILYAANWSYIVKDQRPHKPRSVRDEVCIRCWRASPVCCRLAAGVLQPHTGFRFVGLCFRKPHFGATRLWLPNTTRSACLPGYSPAHRKGVLSILMPESGPLVQISPAAVSRSCCSGQPQFDWCCGLAICVSTLFRLSCTRPLPQVQQPRLSCEEDDLTAHPQFALASQVLEAFVSYDRHTGRPRGFGFVVFEDPQVSRRLPEQYGLLISVESHPVAGSSLAHGRPDRMLIAGVARAGAARIQEVPHPC